jgi:hypothetical protein
MILELPKVDLPIWLSELNVESIKSGDFPLESLLQDSLYYAGAGVDGKPIRWLAGNLHSFIYTDYMLGRDRLLEAINFRCFRGFRIVAQRDISVDEIHPTRLAPVKIEPNDGRPDAFADGLAQPFCIWFVLERLPDYTDEHGPSRFSLLYIGGESVATYNALYNSNHMKPKFLFLINHGFGGNWTNFEDQTKIFARVVRENPAGMPDYLMGRYAHYNDNAECYWSLDYPNPPIFSKDSEYLFGLWRLNKSDKPLPKESQFFDFKAYLENHIKQAQNSE